MEEEEGNEREGREGVGREGKGREGSTWIFVQKPRVPSYALLLAVMCV